MHWWLKWFWSLRYLWFKLASPFLNDLYFAGWFGINFARSVLLSFACVVLFFVGCERIFKYWTTFSIAHTVQKRKQKTKNPVCLTGVACYACKAKILCWSLPNLNMRQVMALATPCPQYCSGLVLGLCSPFLSLRLPFG